MSRSTRLVLFRLDQQRYALPLAAVERIVRAAEVTAVPNAPPVVEGLLDLAGRLLPVVNLRRRFGLEDRALTPADQFLIAHTSRRPVVLIIDEVLELREAPAAELVSAEQIAPGLEHIQGVCQLPDGLVLIHDLERCLSLDEEQLLDQAVEEMAHDR